ncbi:DUF938 domain-containing protein [Henriciella aquimarina]|uniref:DUF938 domain-containing protein n=1 Tax=Henriciella aquimarina TaxID=545261 RepID=UPI000A0706DA|nr:DUF938 domain-containing protein [Henriciella aquimarina]
MGEDRDDIGSRGKSVALEQRNTGVDGRRFSPSVARNAGPIGDVFAAHMPLEGRVLEIASGTGEHGALMVERFPGLAWIYSDIDDMSRASQAAWVQHAGADRRLSGPLEIDASQPGWGEIETAPPLEAIFCTNMVHIAPFAAAEGLIAGAGRRLAPGGKLFLYGPFAREGEIAPSNARFSEDLKRRDPSWGVRDLDRDILPLAAAAGLSLETVVDMPANNLSVIFRKD